MLQTIVSYFMNDPMKLLYVLGGSGGVVYWWDRFWNRPRLRVRLLNEEFEVDESPDLKITTTFEVENIGTEKTSLEHEVLFTAYTVKRRHQRCSHTILEADRSLPPFSPRVITIGVKESATYPFLWFRTYIFRQTRGGSKRLRIRSEDGVRLTYPRFLFELACFRVLNRLPGRR